MFWTALTLISVPILFITNKIINRLHTKTISKRVAYYGWYVLEFCSKVEIKVQNAYAIIKPYIPSFNKENTAMIVVIKDGEEIEKYNLDDFLYLRERGNIIEGTYDFILYELSISNNSKYNKVLLRYNNHKDIMKIEYNAMNEYSFISMQFKIIGLEKIYNINFNKNQFMINGNILFDRHFIKWFMLKYNNTIVQDKDKYYISFIDHNINYIIITDTEHIIVKNKTYEIVKTKESTDFTSIEKKEQ